MTSPVITERAVLGMFYERLMQNVGAGYINAICTEALRSDQDSEDYAWMGMVPQMTELRGEKKFSQLRDTEWTIKNVQYQAGITIPEKHVLYDKTGQVQIRVNELADRANAHWAKLITTLILNGGAALCYDGQYFFDTDHSEGDSGSQSNSVSHNVGTTTDPTATEMIDAILLGVESMLAFKDDRGEYINEDMSEFLVMVGTPLLTNGLKALSQTQVNGGDTNVLIEQDSFRFRVQASPRLASWTDKFAIFATQGNQKPFIRQQRAPNNAGSGFDVDGMRLITLWTDSEHCKKNGECLASVESERAAAYGDWKKSCLVTLT